MGQFSNHMTTKIPVAKIVYLTQIQINHKIHISTLFQQCIQLVWKFVHLWVCVSKTFKGIL